jgi:hypothetical protein
MRTTSIIDRDIARLEENIRILKESIRKLRSSRNKLSPIHCLPAEILCNIFSFTKDLSRTRNPKSWTNFSQVSQSWRSSALRAPGLWTLIPLYNPCWAQEMLIRSKMAKLTIRSDLSFDYYLRMRRTRTIETVRSCLYEMDRVEEINLTGIPRLVLKEIFRDLPKSAPQLHTLCIGFHEDFLYDTERLQRVELYDCEISWDSHLLTGLTSLTIKDCWKTNSSIGQLLHALQRMPALTELHLLYSIPDDSGGASTYPVIDLPCLRILHISSWVSPLTTVLRHITFSHSATLNLTCREKSTQIDFSNFLSVLSTKFLSSLVIRTLGLRAPDDYATLEICSWTDVVPDCFPSPSSLISQSQLQLKLTWPTAPSLRHNYGKVLTCVFEAMELSSLTHFQSSISNCIDSNTWVRTFGNLPLLERVYEQSYSPRSFLEALVYKTMAAEKSETAYRSVSFPKLRSIHLENSYFSGGDRSLSVDGLLDYLMERCERKAEVQMLHLSDCFHVSSDDVERLKEIVVDVIWDGMKQDI